MTVAHYCGHLRRGAHDSRWRHGTELIERHVAEVLQEHGITAIFGSLASGADLLVAEQALALGIEVWAYLPFEQQLFVQLSVTPGGPMEEARFHTLLSQVSALNCLTMPPATANAELAFIMASECAMAAARTYASANGQEAVQVALWDGAPSSRGTARDVRSWTNAGGRCIHIKLPSGELRHLQPSAQATLRGIHIATFNLAAELDLAANLAGQGKSEASIFHSARLLEGVVKAAAGKFDPDAEQAEVFTLLNELGASHILPSPLLRAAHVLRRLGNEVRHVRRKVGGEEHWIALTIARLVAQWYAYDFIKGPRRSSTSDTQPASSVESAVEELLFADKRNRLAAILPSIIDRATEQLCLIDLALERAIDFQLLEEAEQLIRIAKKQATRSRRNLELEGLLYSRNNCPQRTIDLLRYVRRHRGDVELAGILAGAYKRVWLESGQDSQLQAARTLYREAWEQSADPYAGVNVAACSFWLGDVEATRQIAQQVINKFQQRAKLWADVQPNWEQWDFYSLATMAEAYWLAGDREQAELWRQRAENCKDAAGEPLAVFMYQMAQHEVTAEHLEKP